MSEANHQNRYQRCRLARESVMVGWGDLPPELLAMISIGLSNPADICRFRWVCRSWRLSTAPPPNKLSPFFPLLLPCSALRPRILSIHANAIYLIRSRHDLSKAWMVSLEESVTGKLVPRHAISYTEILGAGNMLDLLASNDWIVTQVARSYAENQKCRKCNGVGYIEKASAVSRNNCSSPLVGLCRIRDFMMGMCAFELGLRRGEARVIHLDCGYRPRIVDFVKLKGWIYAVDFKGCVYVVDRDKSRLHLVCSCDLLRYKHDLELVDDVDNPYNLHLVVSDDDIYVVLSLWWYTCRIYRLVNIISNENGMMTRGKWKRVRDLGDRLFFLTKSCSFSISAADLPPPWIGNCVVVMYEYYNDTCRCFSDEPQEEKVIVYFIGGQFHPKQQRLHLLDGYSDLFALPSSWTSSTHNHNQAEHKKTAPTRRRPLEW